MGIDTKRLETDAAYWDEVAPNGKEWAIVKNGKFLWWQEFEIGSESERGCQAIRKTRPQSEWVDGLPPVGCKCEVDINMIDISVVGTPDGWRWCEILAHRDECAIVWIPSANLAAKVCNRAAFRPLRTKEQRQRDELEYLIESAYATNGVKGVADAMESSYNLEPKDA